MNNNKKILFVVIVLGVLLGGFIFMNQKSSSQDMENDKINIVTSFYPLQYLAETIGGEHVAVTGLTPPGVEPHDFEPSPKDIKAVSKADIFLYNGGGFEPWVSKWTTGNFEKMPYSVNMVKFLQDAGVGLIDKGNVADPHVWLDPSLMKKEVEILRDILATRDPSNESIYTSNASRLSDKLDALDAQYKESLASCEVRDIVVSHEAFGYLGRAYGISIISIAGISPDEEPSTKTLAHISDIAKERNIKFVFFEAVASPKLSLTIAREIGAETLVLNTLESLTAEELRQGKDYMLAMEENLNNLKKAMICK